MYRTGMHHYLGYEIGVSALQYIYDHECVPLSLELPSPFLNHDLL